MANGGVPSVRMTKKLKIPSTSVALLSMFFFSFFKKRRIFGPGTNPTRISNSYMISSEILLVYSIYSTVVYSQVDHVQLFFINLFIQDNTKARRNEDSTSKQSEILNVVFKKKMEVLVSYFTAATGPLAHYLIILLLY